MEIKEGGRAPESDQAWFLSKATHKVPFLAEP